MMFGAYPRKPPKPEWHYEVSLVEEERAALLALLDTDKKPTIAMRRYISKRIRDAKRHEGKPLPDAALDWAAMELEAMRQGVSVAEIFYDRAGRAQEPK